MYYDITHTTEYDYTESVAIATKVHRCQADTMKEKAANDVYVRSVRLRSSTEAPIAKITSAARSAETAWTFTPGVYQRFFGTASSHVGADAVGARHTISIVRVSSRSSPATSGSS